jgi:hypothetical protein
MRVHAYGIQTVIACKGLLRLRRSSKARRIVRLLGQYRDERLHAQLPPRTQALRKHAVGTDVWISVQGCISAR